MFITHFFSKNLAVILSVFLTFCLHGQNNVPDTIYPLQEILPHEISGNQAVNLQLVQAEPIGDINGDGFTDFVFRDYTPDERTEDPDDFVFKSIIVTDINKPDSAIVLYSRKVYGINDFNGDGFDDIIDIPNKMILFGGETGITNDSLLLNYPDEINYLFYSGDISGDGKSELFLGREFTSSFIIYSGPDTGSIEFNPPVFGFFHKGNYDFLYDDYDHDGIKELIINREKSTNQPLIEWYVFDTINKEMVREDSRNSFISGRFCDLNGDGWIDLAGAYFDPEYGFQFKVATGKEEYPYLNMPEVIENNFLYPVFFIGDINNDGFDDWYSKCHKDTIVLFSGNADIMETGLTREKYALDVYKQFVPIGKYRFDFNAFTQPVLFDYNMDAIPDFLLNYWSFDSNYQIEKAGTAIIEGDTDPDFENPTLLVRERWQSYTSLKYGHRTKNLGDINHDGFPDWGTLARDGCYAEIFLGGANSDTKPDAYILLPQDGFAQCLDWDAGDINNDGLMDIIISNGSNNEGYSMRNMVPHHNRVFIFLGKEEYSETLNYQQADYVLQDTGIYFYDFGKNLAIVGDYNHDGFNDLVVGGGKHARCLREACIYFGGDEISQYPDMIISVQCTQCGVAFADPVTACGDINGDGYDDFTLGDPDNGRGQSLIYLGGPDADSLFDIAIKHPNDAWSNYGRYTARNKGDYDGDGHPDLIYHFTDTIYLFRGGPDFDTICDMKFYDSTITTPVSFVEFIPSFSRPDKSDIILGDYLKPGLILFSETFSLNDRADYIFHNERPNIKSACTGDFNQDGYVEVFAGNPDETNYGGIIIEYQSPVNTALREYEAEKDFFRIYPNPAWDNLNIILPHDDFRAISFELYSLDGRKLLTGNNRKINIDNIPHGMYFITVLAENTRLQTKKFIKY